MEYPVRRPSISFPDPTVPALRFAPIFQPYVWGGRSLARWYPEAPATGPLAEAWLVSDEDQHRSAVAHGPWAGRILRDLIQDLGPRLLGQARLARGRFPLLLKFLDAREVLSVQVHPTDDQAETMRPGTLGKTEAWVILDAAPGSKLYLGLKPGVDRPTLADALRAGTVPDLLHVIHPLPGEVYFVPAGTVHAIGAGLQLFEIQETSDNTFRLHDWGRGRPVHLDESLTCTAFAQPITGAGVPVVETTGGFQRERLIDCPYFRLWRVSGDAPFPAGMPGECRVVVAVDGSGMLEHAGTLSNLTAGDAVLLPAENGLARCLPDQKLTVLECGLPI